MRNERKTILDKTKQDKPRQKQHVIRQYTIITRKKQDKTNTMTRQDKPRHDETMQNKTRQG